VCDNEFAVGTSALSVDNALGDAFTGEVGKLVEEVEVLEQDGTLRSNSQGILVIVNRVPLGVCNGSMLHWVLDSSISD
jgi:hypothetical protein